MPSLSDILLMVINTLKLATVEPYLFFSLFGYTVRLVTFQSLLMDSACRNLHLYGDEICGDLGNYKEHQEKSIEAGNNLYAQVMLISSLPAILVAVFLGPWSDKYSRKYPLVISAFGLMLEATTSAVLTFFPSASPVWYVMAGIFSGFSGGFIMCNSAAFSYMSDVTDERSRSARYAVLEFSNIFAVVLGSILGGQIFNAGGYKPVMILAPFSFGSAVLYAALVIKDTKQRPKGVQCSDMMKDLVTIDNIKQSYKTCTVKRPGNIRLQIWLLVWVSCSQKFVDMGTLAIAFPFARGMYNWNVTDFSNASTIFYVANAIATVVIVPILANKLRLHEAALGVIGMLSLMAKMTINSVAYNVFLFYYGWLSGVLNNSAGIAIRSRLSKLVEKEELGRAFSLLATCESVTPLLGTLAFSQIYNASHSFFPGLAFASAAIFLIPSLLIFGWMMGLPTISLGDYAKEDVDYSQHSNQPDEASLKYIRLDEENF